MTNGWAFLVARGQGQGYRSRLVPDVLAQRGLSGVVEEVAGEHGEPGGAAVVRTVATPRGPVAVVYRIHRITPGDVGDARPVRDEHGRPLDIIYGFVCLADTIASLDSSDLDTSLQQALSTYHLFLDDEHGFAGRTSTAFPLRSTVASARATPRRMTTADSTIRHPTKRTRTVAVLALGVLALGVFVLVRVMNGSDGSPADFAGTWTGQLAPVASGAPTRRQVTVTVNCPPDHCERGQTLGDVRDLACSYTLTMNRISGGELRATVVRSGGAATGCLPNGRVTLQRTGDTARLDWYAGEEDEPLMRASTLESDPPA